MKRKTLLFSTFAAAIVAATMGLTALSTPAAAHYGGRAHCGHGYGYGYGAGYGYRDDGYYAYRPVTRFRAVRMMRWRGFRNIYSVYCYRGFWVIKGRGRVTPYGYRPWHYIRFINARSGRIYRTLPRYARYWYRYR